MFDNLKIYSDRMPVAELQRRDPEVLHLLKRLGKGKAERKERVQFCGMLISPETGVVLFLPLYSDTSDIASCRRLMKVLSLYGSERERRSFDGDADYGTTGLLSVISKLAADFKENGLYSERHRIRGRDIGKPNWPHTIKRVQPLWNDEGEAVYSTVMTVRSVDSREILLGQIHAQVMNEILSKHGWWLDGVTSRREELRSVGQPAYPRQVWAKLVGQFLSRVYSSRGMYLAQLLISYLENSRTLDTGRFAFGLDDFHSVWERMLYRGMPNVVSDINLKLPYASYLPDPSRSEVMPVKRTMRTDIVATIDGGYALLDAKYYMGHSSEDLPGWGDIAKQFIYEQALKEFVGADQQILNAFVFPSASNDDVRYTEIEMQSSVSGRGRPNFPTVKIIGMKMADVMQSYIENKKLPAISSVRSGN